MSMTASQVENNTTKDPAVLRYDSVGRPVYRREMAPEGLDTTAQLRARRLSTAGLEPAAWLYYACIGHRVCALYDRAHARPIRPLTERQREVLAEGRELANTVTCQRCDTVRVSARNEPYCDPCWQTLKAEQADAWQRRILLDSEAHERLLADDRAAATSWAAEALSDPRLAVLDTETTGLLDGPDPAYMVEISALTGDRTVLLDTLINPQIPIPASATAIHGITDTMVADAPTFSDLLPELSHVLGGRRTVIYNQAFDTGILRRELDRHYRASDPIAMTKPGRTHPTAERWISTLRAECAMEWYAQWFGDWHDYWQSYTWQPLCGGHRARGDCEATLERLRSMATPSQRAQT